ncbi:MAG: hypothetical protein ABIR48_07450 [Gammaproteobacteria bacterium]
MHVIFSAGFAALVSLPFIPVVNADTIPQAPPTLERAQQLLEEAEETEAQAILREILKDPQQHSAAYGQLVWLALVARDQARLNELFDAYWAYPFEDPEQFQGRIEFYELQDLREIYNQAIQDFMARRWPPAEQGFSRLLGDAAFHRQAASWLFRIAMKQKDFERAQFIAGLARLPTDDAASSPNILGACAAQRKSDRQKSQEGLTLITNELKQRNGYGESPKDRLAAQRMVFVAMVRLHNEIDQCFRFAMNTPAEARPLFPDLPDKVLAYLAR